MDVPVFLFDTIICWSSVPAFLLYQPRALQFTTVLTTPYDLTLNPLHSFTRFIYIYLGPAGGWAVTATWNGFWVRLNRK